VVARRKPASRKPATLKALARPRRKVAPRAKAVRIAGVGNEAVMKATGRAWEEWLRVLDRAGFDVLNAQDGLEAIELLSHAGQAPSLVVTDIRMPRMGGLELGQWVGTRYPGVPLLYVSGFLYEAPPLVSENGPRAFLGKPFTPDAFLAQVRELCARNGGCGEVIWTSRRPHPG
jgi:CheY-like chemotaxis protein